jgi:hypothetical protein
MLVLSRKDGEVYNKIKEAERRGTEQDENSGSGE